jgi:hypothetical protein
VSYYLLDHRNPHGEHFHRTRRGSVLALVVHVTAGLEDLDATDDHSAERTAAYAAGTDRQVSWHDGSDTDSALELLPWSMTAFHVQGYNSRTVGHEISKAHADWRSSSPVWIDRTLVRAADHLRPKLLAAKIPLRRATKAELDRAIATNGAPVGLVAHADLDPDRRRDPGYVARPPAGDTFPWSRFLELLAARPEELSNMVYVAAKIPPQFTGPWPGGRWTFAALTAAGRIDFLNDVSALDGKSDVHFGDARDVRLSKPAVDFAFTPGGRGYWIVSEDGGVFTYGDAPFHGSMAGKPLTGPVSTIVPLVTEDRATGYVLLAEDGGSFNFGSGVPLH